MQSWMDYFMSKELAIAGAAGATVASLAQWPGWVAFIRHFIVGMLFASYGYEFGVAIMTPVFAVVNFSDDRRAAAGAFLTGAIAIVLVQYVIEFVQIARGRLANKDDKGGDKS